MDRADPSSAPASTRLGWVYAVFIVSGFAALLYQVCWQRALFAIFGINIEAVTVVVTAFMLGLGVGSLAGGEISKRPTRPVLLYFSAVEAGIGGFGLASLRLFDAVGSWTLHAPSWVVATASLVLVLIPTTLMGATLPLLVAHAVRQTHNVGRSVGMLYFVNTLGSAVASFAAVLALLPQLALSGSIRVAAALNFTVALAVLVAHLRSRKGA